MEQLSSPGECEAALLGGVRGRSGAGSKGTRGRGSAWGSISRVFARSRHRTKSGSAAISGHESGEFRTPTKRNRKNTKIFSKFNWRNLNFVISRSLYLHPNSLASFIFFQINCTHASGNLALRKSFLQLHCDINPLSPSNCCHWCMLVLTIPFMTVLIYAPPDSNWRFWHSHFIFKLLFVHNFVSIGTTDIGNLRVTHSGHKSICFNVSQYSLLFRADLLGYW